MQNLIDIPEKCLAYSANWYMNEISAYDTQSGLFAFGSNSDIYIINYKEKKYETIIYNNNMREKISCVQFISNSNVYEEIEEQEGDQKIEESIIIAAGSSSGTFCIYEYSIANKKYNLLEQQILVTNQTITSINLDRNQFNPYISTIDVQLQNGSTFTMQLDHLQKKLTSMKISIQQSKFNLKLKLQSQITSILSQNYNQEVISSTIKPKTKSNYSLHFFEEGQIFLYQNYTNVMSHQIDGKILTIDEFPSLSYENSKKYMILKKIKNYLFLNLIEVQQNAQKDQNQNTENKQNASSDIVQNNQDLNEYENTSEVQPDKVNANQTQPPIKQNKYSIKSILDIEIFLIYGKKHNDLLQSSFTIKSLDHDNFILTGKIGDMYIFNLSKLLEFSQNSSKVTINPLSAQFNDTFYTKVPDSNHYDGIFAIQTTSDNKLITLSTDRRISFFNILSQNLDQSEQLENNQIEQDQVNPDEQVKSFIPFSLEFEWQLNCLGGKVNSLVTSQVEKELVYMSCLDHTVRVWDSSKTHDQLYVKEYYKRIDQFKVKQMILHPTFENIMILFLEDNPKKLVGYDLFKEKVSFEYVSNRDILNLKWIHKDLIEELQNIQFEQASMQRKDNGREGEEIIEKEVKKQIKIEGDKIEVKEKNLLTQGDEYNLLIFKKGGYITLIDLSEGSIDVEDYSICENKNNVQQFDLEIVNNQIFSVFAQLGCISFYSDYQYKQFQNMHKNVVKSIAFKQTQDNQLIIACASLDRKISLYYGNPADIQTFQFVSYLKHEYPIETVRFSPIQDSYYLLSLAQNHNTVQIYNLLPDQINQFINNQSNSSNTNKSNNEINNEDEEDDEKEDEDIAIQVLNKTKENPQQIMSFEYKNIRGHRGYINDAVFSPLDQNLIITCSDDQTVKFWQIDSIINKSYPKRKKNKNNKGQNADNEDTNEQLNQKGNQQKQNRQNFYPKQNQFKQNKSEGNNKNWNNRNNQQKNYQNKGNNHNNKYHNKK